MLMVTLKKTLCLCFTELEDGMGTLEKKGEGALIREQVFNRKFTVKL